MSADEKLALDGGPLAKSPYASASRYDGNEKKYLLEALEQNSLFYGFGTFVHRCCELMRAYTELPYAVACSSGSAALHAGMIAAGVGPGDEVICTPNTDMGSVLGAICEGAVPVFCDCEMNLQPSVATIERCVTERTKAVVVVHLSGHPAPVDEIVAFCDPRGIAVIEDCAQAWGTRLKGRRVGTFGLAGCFSLNDFKHISCGDGGVVVMRDADLYRRVSNFVDKYYDRFFDKAQYQAHHGLNYRMTELQGAVACAQLERADDITERYHAMGERLREGICCIPGLDMIGSDAGGYGTYWWCLMTMDASAFTCSRDHFVKAFAAEGVMAGSFSQYDLIQKPLFRDRIAKPWLSGKAAMYPFVQPDGREYVYSVATTPNHKRLLDCGIQITLKSYFSDQDIEEMILAAQKVAAHFSKA